jgi:hypothetical protein
MAYQHKKQVQEDACDTLRKLKGLNDGLESNGSPLGGEEEATARRWR